MAEFYITMAQVGRMLGWETRRAKRWLRRKGAAVKHNGRWVTTLTLLHDHFPELWAKFAARVEVDRPFEIEDGR